MINIDNVLAESLVSIRISDIKKPFNEQPRIKIQRKSDQDVAYEKNFPRYLTPKNPSTNIVYVANRGDDTVSVIDGKTNKVTTTIPVGTSPNGLSVNPSTNIVYVANRGDDTVSVIDGKTNTIIANIITHNVKLFKI